MSGLGFFSWVGQPWSIKQDSPGGEQDSPGVEQDSPGVEQDSPGAEQDSPGVEQDSLGAEQDSPGVEQNSPGAEQHSPGAVGRLVLQCILLGFLWAPQFFPMGSACCLMGSEALSHYLRWAPHGLLLGSCVFAGVCNGLCVGGYWASMGSSWAPVFLRVFAVGSRMGSSWAPVFLQLLVVGSRMGSSWAPVFSNYLWWAPAWAPFGLLYFCRYLRWAPAWAPSGLLCFAGHGVLAAKNTIVGFEIRKFPVFLQLWS